MPKIAKGLILPSAAFVLKSKSIKQYERRDKMPEVGDVVYGAICRLGQHRSLENVSGRIHETHVGMRALFVYGNRYAPDYYEGLLPENNLNEVDLLARSGVIGLVKTQNALIAAPTRVRVLGYAIDEAGQVINTRNHSLVRPQHAEKKHPRSRLILVVGTAMNSGKSLAASAAVWALNTMGYSVRGSKVTGTASLKDILHMNDAGADPYNDFTYFGYPSTYLLPEADVLRIFNELDLRYANNARNYWVVELADGIVQRETALLLASNDVKDRIHRLIFCANDAFGAIGGLRVLQERYGLEPDALSGLCSSSPLHIRELAEFTDIPVFNSANPDLNELAHLLVGEVAR